MNTPMSSSNVESECLIVYSLIHILALASLFVVSGSVFDVRAGDIWNDKNYKDWTAEDVYKIKYESPWTKKLAKDAPWLKGRASYLSILPTGCDGRPDLSHANQNSPEMAMGSAIAVVEYRIDWMSSRTMRSAKMRESVLCGTLNQESADEFLEQETDQYQIDVKSADMMPFESMDDEAIRKNTWLIFKKSQMKINPADVGLLRSRGQKRIISMTFKFNKKAEDGTAYLSPDEKEIEFDMQADKFMLKAKFQPAKMMAKDGPDL
jgi:hypothetical protein